MEIIDRVVLTILFMAAIIRPTEPTYLFGFSIVIVWLIWEGMVQLMNRRFQIKGWIDEKREF